MSKTRSARGRIVDFELLRMKEEIKAKPVPKNVEERERFIAEKNKTRRTRRPKLTPPTPEQAPVSGDKEEKQAEPKTPPKKKPRTKVKR